MSEAPTVLVLRRCEHCGAPAQPLTCTVCGRLNAARQTTPLRRYVAVEAVPTSSVWRRGK